VDGSAELLPPDVPQRLVNAGDGAHHQHRAAAVEAAAVHRLPVILDPCRILTE